ncbi:MAG: hypothetical protein J1E80_05195 [Desulfovibrionaceae bacterium]|nr:hypothetical protein [Desulfovibrionaceae bacterium]
MRPPRQDWFQALSGLALFGLLAGAGFQAAMTAQALCAGCGSSDFVRVLSAPPKAPHEARQRAAFPHGFAGRLRVPRTEPRLPAARRPIPN